MTSVTAVGALRAGPRCGEVVRKEVLAEVKMAMLLLDDQLNRVIELPKQSRTVRMRQCANVGRVGLTFSQRNSAMGSVIEGQLEGDMRSSCKAT